MSCLNQHTKTTPSMLRIRPYQGVPPQQVPPPPDAGEQFGGQTPHRGIALRRRPDDRRRRRRRAARLLRLRPNPADDLGRHLNRDVLRQVRPGQADNDQDAARRHQLPEPDKSGASVHVMQRRDSTHQTKARRLQPTGKHVADEILDITGLGVGLAALDARLVWVDADNLRNAPLAERPSEVAVPAPHIHCSLTTRRDDVKHQRLIPGTHPAEYPSPPAATRGDCCGRSDICPVRRPLPGSLGRSSTPNETNGCQPRSPVSATPRQTGDRPVISQVAKISQVQISTQGHRVQPAIRPASPGDRTDHVLADRLSTTHHPLRTLLRRLPGLSRSRCCSVPLQTARPTHRTGHGLKAQL